MTRVIYIMARKKALSIDIAEITANASLKADDYAAIDASLLASADRRACVDRFLAAGYTPTPAFLAEHCYLSFVKP
ncbi:MAG: hypothetical protein NT086_16295 [Proteobacteria bacterium]|nr:hypothetical protein [Pseudomonadota bacterium]